jgi:hypothetical protein
MVTVVVELLLSDEQPATAVKPPTPSIFRIVRRENTSLAAYCLSLITVDSTIEILIKSSVAYLTSFNRTFV